MTDCEQMEVRDALLARLVEDACLATDAVIKSYDQMLDTLAKIPQNEVLLRDHPPTFIP